MKRTLFGLAVCSLALASALLLARSQMAQRNTTVQRPNTASVQAQQLETDRIISTQQRLNRYFHSAVFPKLKQCWASLKGTGVVEFKYKFIKVPTNKWISDEVSIESATLDEGQQPIALKCMQIAVASTSFSALGTERASKEFVMYWSWPVPVPPNVGELTTAMFARRPRTTGGGCNGRGGPPRCWICRGLKCEKACVGLLDCAVGVDSCVTFGECSSGSAFSIGTGFNVIQ